MTGTWQLLRSFLRRDRFAIPAWSVGLALLYWSQAVSVEGLYTTQEEFDRAAASMESNAAFIAMAGPARALNTVGGQVVWQASAFGAVFQASSNTAIAIGVVRGGSSSSCAATAVRARADFGIKSDSAVSKIDDHRTSPSLFPHARTTCFAASTSASRSHRTSSPTIPHDFRNRSTCSGARKSTGPFGVA